MRYCGQFQVWRCRQKPSPPRFARHLSQRERPWQNYIFLLPLGDVSETVNLPRALPSGELARSAATRLRGLISFENLLSRPHCFEDRCRGARRKSEKSAISGGIAPKVLDFALTKGSALDYNKSICEAMMEKLCRRAGPEKRPLAERSSTASESIVPLRSSPARSRGVFFCVKEAKAATGGAGCNLGGTTDFFVPYRRRRSLFFLHRHGANCSQRNFLY